MKLSKLAGMSVATKHYITLLIHSPENHMMNCILGLMLTVLNRLTRKERGKMLAARPIRIKMMLQMIRLKLKEVVMVNSCIPM